MNCNQLFDMRQKINTFIPIPREVKGRTSRIKKNAALTKLKIPFKEISSYFKIIKLTF